MTVLHTGDHIGARISMIKTPIKPKRAQQILTTVGFFFRVFQAEQMLDTDDLSPQAELTVTPECPVGTVRPPITRPSTHPLSLSSWPLLFRP
jgi:hypothetical protein